MQKESVSYSRLAGSDNLPSDTGMGEIETFDNPLSNQPKPIPGSANGNSNRSKLLIEITACVCLILVSLVVGIIALKKSSRSEDEIEKGKAFFDQLNGKYAPLQNNLVGAMQNFSSSINNVNGNLASMQRQLSSLRDTDWFVAFNGYKYQLTSIPMTWEITRCLCQNKGGDLAVFGVRNYTVRLLISRSLPIFNVWVGLHDLDTEGYFVWIDGKNATRANVKWVPGEPNGYTHENCGEIFPASSQYKMNDAPCDSMYRGLCEKKI